MGKRKLSDRQAWRIKKIQEEKVRRAQVKAERLEKQTTDEGLGPEQDGLVTANFGATVEVEDTSRRPYRCSIRQNIDPLVVGDQVVWQAARETNTGVVVALKARKSLMARPDAFGQIKPLAANIDQILVVTAPMPAYDTYLIDQYTVAAEITGIAPVVVFNKIDLLEGEEMRVVEEQLGRYTDIGYQVIFASNRSEHGLTELTKQLMNRFSVFAGQSGVGKSSLIQALLPEQQIRIGEVAEQTRLGRHTTSVSRLYHLPSGGEVIDSPGVREFRLWGMARAELARGFAEFQPFLGTCRFRDCRHDGDPGCALEEAAESGRIHPERLRNFRRMAVAMEQHEPDFA